MSTLEAPPRPPDPGRTTPGQATPGQATPCQSWLPCWDAPDLWFAESPTDVETAKAFCAPCPLRTPCLTGALSRREPWGVWGGELLVDGVVVARKRPRGRPRKHPAPADVPSKPDAPREEVSS